MDQKRGFFFSFFEWDKVRDPSKIHKFICTRLTKRGTRNRTFEERPMSLLYDELYHIVTLKLFPSEFKKLKPAKKKVVSTYNETKTVQIKIKGLMNLIEPSPHKNKKNKRTKEQKNKPERISLIFPSEFPFL